jgi:hypothetical protein
MTISRDMGQALRAEGFNFREVRGGGVVQGMLGRSDSDPFGRFRRAGVLVEQIRSLCWRDDRFVVRLVEASDSTECVERGPSPFEGRPHEELCEFTTGGGYVAQIGGDRSAGFSTAERFQLFLDSLGAYCGAQPRKLVFSPLRANRLAWSARNGLWAQPKRLLLGKSPEAYVFVDEANGEVSTVPRQATAAEMSDPKQWSRLGRLPKPNTGERVSWRLELVEGGGMAVKVLKPGGYGFSAALHDDGRRLGPATVVTPPSPIQMTSVRRSLARSPRLISVAANHIS